MIDKNTLSVEDARDQLYSQIIEGAKVGDIYFNIHEMVGWASALGSLMAKSPEMERAIIAYLLAVRKQEESKDAV